MLLAWIPLWLAGSKPTEIGNPHGGSLVEPIMSLLSASCGRRPAAGWRLGVVWAICAVMGACGKKQSTPEPTEGVDPVLASTPAPAPSANPPAALPAQAADLPGPAENEREARHAWSFRLGAAESDAARAVAMDEQGNTFITGYFTGAVTFGPTQLTSAGGTDVYLIKVSPTGQILWARQLGGPGDDIGQAVAATADGAVAVAGTFTETATVGGGKPVASAGRTDLFLAVYDADGQHKWSRTAGGEVEDRAYAVAFARDGGLYVTGYFGATADFGGGPLISAGQADLFAAQYSPNGEHVWSWRIGGKADDLGRGLALAPNGDVVIAGDFQDKVSIGGKDYLSAGNADVLVARFTGAGQLRWARGFGAPFHDFAVSTAVDSAGNAVVTGAFEGSIDFGGGDLKSGRKKDIFVVKLAPDGSHLWSKSFASADDDLGSAVAVDRRGNVFFTGWFWQDVNFGGGALRSAGENDIVLGKLAPNGEHIWSRRFGDAGADFGRALAVDDRGELVVVGTYRGTINLGGDDLVFAGDRKRASGDIFVGRFRP
jgi:hypothetical protein